MAAEVELATDDIADFVEIVVGCKIVVAVVVDIVDFKTYGNIKSYLLELNVNA